MRISYTHYVFDTCTYDREDSSLEDRWRSVSRDSDDFIKRVSRENCGIHNIRTCGFIRVIEAHQDGNPHIHFLLWFQDAITVENSRYFTNQYFKFIQSQWRRGFSKPEVLRDKTNVFAYTLKYFRKQLPSVQPSKFAIPSAPKARKLKGKYIEKYGCKIKLLDWSKNMQKLYLDHQTRILVLNEISAKKSLLQRTISEY